MREFKESVSGKDEDETSEPSCRPGRPSTRRSPPRPASATPSKPAAGVEELLPRRLGHGEEATLVEHLGELRSRIVISLVALVLAFSVRFAFHDRIIELAHAPAARPTSSSDAQRHRAVHDLGQGQHVRRVRARAPDRHLAALELPRPRPRAAHAAHRLRFVALATGLFAAGVAFGYFVVLPRAIVFLTNFDDDALQRPDPGDLLLLVRAARDGRRRASSSRCPSSCWRSCAPRLSSPDSYAATGASGSSWSCSRRPLPTRRPDLARRSRRSRLLASTSSRSGSRRCMERGAGSERYRRDRERPATLSRIISADWVLPVERPPIAGRRGRDRGRTHRRGRRRERARRGRAFR